MDIDQIRSDAITPIPIVEGVIAYSELESFREFTEVSVMDLKDEWYLTDDILEMHVFDLSLQNLLEFSWEKCFSLAQSLRSPSIVRVKSLLQIIAIKKSIDIGNGAHQYCLT